MKKTLFSVISLILILPPLALAQGIEIKNPLKAESFEALINNLINFFFYLAVALTPLMITIAGIQYLTAGGDEKKIESAKKIITYTIIGFAIILLAKGLISVIKGVLGVQ
jgi:cytochrome bd-type quinol oxidase subunit 2